MMNWLKKLILFSLMIPVIQLRKSGLNANLSSKNDIADFARKTNFVEKLTNISKNFNSNKTKHYENEENLLIYQEKLN